LNLRFLNPIDLNGRISASSRIRIVTPSNGMEKLGFDGGFNKPANSDSIGVISKTSIQHWNPKCKKMIWDVCDNYFSDRRRSQALQLLKKCHAVTTTTNKLKEVIEDECKKLKIDKKIFIIDDPVFYEFNEPSFAPKDVLKVTWYGNDGNLQYADWNKLVFGPLKERQNELPPIKFTVINRNGTMPSGVNFLNGESRNVKWTERIQRTIASKSDFIILPINPEHPFTIGKSHNKLVDGLACGTMVLASAQDSYLKFSDYAYVNDNFVDNMIECLNNPAQTLERIRLGQEYIQQKLSDINIAKQWIEVVEELSNE